MACVRSITNWPAVSRRNTEALGETWGLFLSEVSMSLIWQMKPPVVPYVHQEYPKYVGEVVVQNADEEAALLKASKQKPKRDTDK